jgi:hypothetical protein
MFLFVFRRRMQRAQTSVADFTHSPSLGSDPAQKTQATAQIPLRFATIVERRRNLRLWFLGGKRIR